MLPAYAAGVPWGKMPHLSGGAFCPISSFVARRRIDAKTSEEERRRPTNIFQTESLYLLFSSSSLLLWPDHDRSSFVVGGRRDEDGRGRKIVDR